MSQRSASLENTWDFGPDVPTYDVFEHRDLRNVSDLESVVIDLTESLERSEFLRWEAVVCQERGLPLTERQRQALGELINLSAGADKDRILSINGLPRPSQPWYEIVRKLAPHLLVTPLKTFESHHAVTIDGWNELVSALEQHAQDLSLPEGVARPVEVVPAELRHRLGIQTCFEALAGLGQAPDLTLTDEKEQFRIDEFVAALREHRESVAYLRLTLEGMLRTLILPPADEPIFTALMKQRLGLAATTEPIAERLG